MPAWRAGPAARQFLRQVLPCPLGGGPRGLLCALLPLAALILRLPLALIILILIVPCALLHLILFLLTAAVQQAGVKPVRPPVRVAAGVGAR